MNKYLSLVYLYNRASCKKLILIAAALAVSLLAYMFILRSLDGIVPVVVFISALVSGMMAVVTSFNGKKAVKGDCSTTGYTIRRLCHSPLRSYLTMFVYYLMVIAIFWFAAIASIYIIGRLDVTGTGATDPDTRLALEFLQTGVFLELSCFFHNPVDVGNLISSFSAFSKTRLNIRELTVHVLLKPGLENFENYFTSM